MYTFDKNKITVPNRELDIKTTLECGQTFRFYEKDGRFTVVSGDKIAICYTDGANSIIETENPSYFANFFDLDVSYDEIVGKYVALNDKFICEAAKYGSGIKILRQNPMEMIFEFIISANNNIPRIKKIIEKISATLGRKIFIPTQDEPFYIFPSPEVLASASLEILRGCGAGYRAPYIVETATFLRDNPSFIMDETSLSTEDALKKLLSLKGVGPKVADCILLFGFHRTDTYPVDTWIEKHYRKYSGDDISSPKEIRKIMLARFGADSGIVQQYIFNFIRNVSED